MNSSVTPMIPPGLSLSGFSPLPASPSSKCAKCTAGFFRSGWLLFKFLQGEEGSSPWFGGTISSLGSGASGQLYRIFLLSFSGSPLGNLSTSSPVGLPLGRLPLIVITWEVCCKSNPSSTLPHDLGENSQGRKWLKLEDALKGKCPSLTLFFIHYL